MTHYVAIVEEEEGKAFGVWFPDLGNFMVALIPFPAILRRHAAE